MRCRSNKKRVLAWFEVDVVVVVEAVDDVFCSWTGGDGFKSLGETLLDSCAVVTASALVSLCGDGEGAVEVDDGEGEGFFFSFSASSSFFSFDRIRFMISSYVIFSASHLCFRKLTLSFTHLDCCRGFPFLSRFFRLTSIPSSAASSISLLRSFFVAGLNLR